MNLIGPNQTERSTQQVTHKFVYFHYSRFGHLSTKQVYDSKGVQNRFWNPEKTEIRCTHPTSELFSIFCRSEKKCILDHLYTYLRVFLCFTCKYGVFWVFSIKMSHVHGPKNTTSTWNQILKISEQILFDLKTSNPVLNSAITIHSLQS